MNFLGVRKSLYPRNRFYSATRESLYPQKRTFEVNREILKIQKNGKNRIKIRNFRRNFLIAKVYTRKISELAHAGKLIPAKPNTHKSLYR